MKQVPEKRRKDESKSVMEQNGCVHPAGTCQASQLPQRGVQVTLLDELISSLGHSEAKVRDVRVGVVSIGVLSHHLGLAHACPQPHRSTVRDAGRLIGKNALELAEYARSSDPIEVGIGVAAINSLIEPRGEKLNVMDFLIEQGKGKTIAMVGHFPRADAVKQVAGQLWVLEKDPRPGDFPESEAANIIPQADIVAITGSTLANGSLQSLLELSRGYTIVFGPSTPLSPVLFDWGVDMIGGTRVTNPDAILLKISQGGNSVCQFKDDLEFLAMRRR
jgi:uncharacterized protein (DUF4213/DUF364 family)